MKEGADYQQHAQKVYKTSMSHCDEKLARLLFDFGVVNTKDNDCEQQIPSVALRLQQLTTPAARQRSWLVSCGLAGGQTGGCANSCRGRVTTLQTM